MEVFAVIEEMLTLFIIMAIGYIANKVSFITKEGNRLLSKLIVNITCLLYTSGPDQKEAN